MAKRQSYKHHAAVLADLTKQEIVAACKKQYGTKIDHGVGQYGRVVDWLASEYDNFFATRTLAQAVHEVGQWMELE